MEWEGRKDGWYQGSGENDGRDDCLHKAHGVGQGEKKDEWSCEILKIDRKSDRFVNIS